MWTWATSSNDSLRLRAGMKQNEHGLISSETDLEIGASIRADSEWTAGPREDGYVLAAAQIFLDPIQVFKPRLFRPGATCALAVVTSRVKMRNVRPAAGRAISPLAFAWLSLWLITY
jgi:hypothetical protein